MFHLSRRSRTRLNGVEPILIEIIEDSLKVSPYDFGIPRYGGLRSESDQNELYAQGRTAPGNIITHIDGTIRKSYHQTGKAFDVFGYVNGKATWDEDILTAIAETIIDVSDSKGICIQWGGHWKRFKDLPHYQI